MGKVIPLSRGKKRENTAVLHDIDKWVLMDMLHEAKRHRRTEEAEAIEKEFKRRDLIVVNKSLWGK